MLRKNVLKFMKQNYQVILILLVYFMISVYAQHEIYHSINSHRDTGIYLDVMHKSLEGNFFFTIETAMSYLGDHFEFALIFLLPFYFIFKSPMVIFVAQTILFTIGGILVYIYSKETIKTKIMNYVFLITYLLSPIVLTTNLRDFHAVAIAVPLVLGILYTIKKENWKWYYFLTILLMLVKENMTLIAMVIGVYLFFKKKRKHAVNTLIIGVVSFIIIVNILIPAFNTGEYFGEENTYLYFERNYGYLGSSASEAVKTLITQPVYALTYLPFEEKITYVFNALRFNHFLPLLNPLTLLAAPTIGQNVLNTFVISTECFTYHTNSMIIPFFIISSILGFAFLERKIKYRWLLRIIILIILVNVIINSITAIYPFFTEEVGTQKPNMFIQNPECYKNHFQKNDFHVQLTKEELKEFYSIIDNIQPRESIKGTFYIYPIVYTKQYLPLRLKSDTWNSDYIIVDLKDKEFLLGIEMSVFKFKEILLEKGYTIIWEKKNLIVLKR